MGRWSYSVTTLEQRGEGISKLVREDEDEARGDEPMNDIAPTLMWTGKDFNTPSRPALEEFEARTAQTQTRLHLASRGWQV